MAGQMEEIRLAMAVQLSPQGSMLMMRRRNPNEWQLPGGRCEPLEAPLAALVRETLAKTGVEIKGARLLNKEPEILALGEKLYNISYHQILQTHGDPMPAAPHIYSDVSFQPFFGREVQKDGRSLTISHLEKMLESRAISLELPTF